MWDCWRSGDRKAALAAIGDDVVDELIVHGSPAQCLAHIQRYVENGVTTPVVMPLPFAGTSAHETMRLVAPKSNTAS